MTVALRIATIFAALLLLFLMSPVTSSFSGQGTGMVFSKVWTVQSNQVALSLTQLSNGNIVAAGDDGAIPNSCKGNFGGAWLINVNPNGENVWQKLYSSCATDAQTAEYVSKTSDGGLILAGGDFSNPACSSGFLSGCGWIAKLTSTGRISWQEDMIYGEGAGVGDLIQTPDGGYIGVGDSQSSSYVLDGLIMKISSTGALEWILNYSETANSFPGAYPGGELEFNSVALASDGGYIVSGVAGAHFSSGYGWVLVVMKVTSQGAVQWSDVYNSSSWQSAAPGDSNYNIFETSDGGYILAGTVSPPVSAPRLFFLMKLDSGGNIVWLKGYGGSSSGGYHFNEGVAAYATSDGGYILAGQSNAFLDHGYHGWIVKTDSYGNIQWQKVYTEIQKNESYFNDIIQTSGGGYAATAYTYTGSESYGGPGFAVLEIDANGNIGNCTCVHNTSTTAQSLKLNSHQATFATSIPTITLSSITYIVAKNTNVTPITIYP
jgi:hypothetical protein